MILLVERDICRYKFINIFSVDGRECYGTFSSSKSRGKSRKTLKEIQSMFSDDKGWDSEKSMLEEMTAFRKKRLGYENNTGYQCTNISISVD